MASNPKPRAVIGSPWWLRLALYVLVAVVGLVLTVLGLAQPEQVDAWLGQVGSVAALIGGLLAAANTGRESDEKPVAVEVPEPQSIGDRIGQRVDDAIIGLPVYRGPTSAG